MRNNLTRKQTGRRRNDSLAKHTCTQELRVKKLHVPAENSVLAPQETIWRTDNVHICEIHFFEPPAEKGLFELSRSSK